MIERLLNQSAAGVLEQSAGFHAARHKVLAENVVNLSTPGYRQKDLDEGAFRSELRKRIENRDAAGTVDLSGLDSPAARARAGEHLVFHDGNDRSVEQLMGQQAENALRHNLSVELLRKQYGLFQMALREQVA